MKINYYLFYLLALAFGCSQTEPLAETIAVKIVQHDSTIIAKSEQQIFNDSVEVVANDLGVPAQWLLAIVSNECRNNPAAKNKRSSATGIIQMTNATAKALGTTTAKIRKMDRAQQMTLVRAYFADGIKRFGSYSSLVDMYLWCLLPAARKYSADDNAVVMQQGDDYYKGNSGLDLNKDGKVVVGEVRKRIESKL